MNSLTKHFNSIYDNFDNDFRNKNIIRLVLRKAIEKCKYMQIRDGKSNKGNFENKIRKFQIL